MKAAALSILAPCLLAQSLHVQKQIAVTKLIQQLSVVPIIKLGTHELYTLRTSTNLLSDKTLEFSNKKNGNDDFNLFILKERIPDNRDVHFGGWQMADGPAFHAFNGPEDLGSNPSVIDIGTLKSFQNVWLNDSANAVDASHWNATTDPGFVIWHCGYGF